MKNIDDIKQDVLWQNRYNREYFFLTTDQYESLLSGRDNERNELLNKIHSLNQEADRLGYDLDEAEGRADDLESERDSLADQVDDLEAKVVELEAKITELENNE